MPSQVGTYSYQTSLYSSGLPRELHSAGSCPPSVVAPRLDTTVAPSRSGNASAHESLLGGGTVRASIERSDAPTTVPRSDLDEDAPAQSAARCSTSARAALRVVGAGEHGPAAAVPHGDPGVEVGGAAGREPPVARGRRRPLEEHVRLDPGCPEAPARGRQVERTGRGASGVEERLALDRSEHDRSRTGVAGDRGDGRRGQRRSISVRVGLPAGQTAEGDRGDEDPMGAGIEAGLDGPRAALDDATDLDRRIRTFRTQDEARWGRCSEPPS